MTRSVKVEIEVPGTPEEVWDAIATGPGIGSWFVPAEVDGRPGGRVTHRHFSGDPSTSEILAWEPPRRLVYGERDGLADEFVVEARGGTCVVRVVTSGFGDGADWDSAIEGTRFGWESALHLLRAYLSRFRGEHGAPVAIGVVVPWARERAWAELTSGLGLPAAAAPGDRVATDGAPPLAGVVERSQEGELVLALEQPAPGAAAVYSGGPGEETYAFVRLYLFGPDAPAVAEREARAWDAWAGERLPAPA